MREIDQSITLTVRRMRGAMWRVVQKPYDSSRERLLNLSVTRYGLRDTRDRIPIPVVTCAMADEDTSETLNRADQIDAFHYKLSSPRLRMPEISPPVRSR